MEYTAGVKRGYLRENFLFFHINDKRSTEFESHYHEFNKIIVFISGNVTYLIEGRAYKLKPWDILLVSSSEVHKPVIDANVPYERIVIWLNTKFILNNNIGDDNLLTCFDMASRSKVNVLRIDPEGLKGLRHLLNQLEEAYKNKGFGDSILKNALLLQFIVGINRIMLGSAQENIDEDLDYDKNIDEILKFINENLTEDLSIENLAERFFISKYYLMHKFKEQTGYTMHSYIVQKRLFLANELMKKGMAVTEACIECGFGDYSGFIRAFKKVFGMAPKKYYTALLRLEKN